MNYGEIRDTVVERMSEYQGGAAEAAGNASISDTVIYKRITRSYRAMVRELAKVDPTKVCDLASFTYTGTSESVALPNALITRDIFSLERSLGNNDWERLEQLTLAQERNINAGAGWPSSSSYGYRVEKGSLLYLLPIPSGDLTLRARYLAEIPPVTVADSAAEPALLPAEDHDLLALHAALSLLRETGRGASLEAELALLWSDFLRSAASSPKTGPRFVYE